MIDVEGLPTAFRREGAGERVLYLHGIGLTRAWLPFFDELARGHDVIVPEHPGFGDTPLPETLMGFDDLVIHYDGLLAALELDPVHVVAQGFGAWIAAELAVFYPRRFQTLTLITPTGVRAAPRVAAPGVDPFRLETDELLALLVNGREERYAEHFRQEGFPGDLLQRYQEDTALARVSWNPRYDAKLDRRLPRVTTPTLVLAAEDDRYVRAAAADRYAELIPGARLVTVEGAEGERSGHLLQLEHPGEVAQLVAEHVAANAALTPRI